MVGFYCIFLIVILDCFEPDGQKGQQEGWGDSGSLSRVNVHSTLPRIYLLFLGWFEQDLKWVFFLCGHIYI